MVAGEWLWIDKSGNKNKKKTKSDEEAETLIEDDDEYFVNLSQIIIILGGLFIFEYIHDTEARMKVIRKFIE